jgi:hypothetical protein
MVSHIISDGVNGAGFVKIMLMIQECRYQSLRAGGWDELCLTKSSIADTKRNIGTHSQVILVLGICE